MEAMAKVAFTFLKVAYFCYNGLSYLFSILFFCLTFKKSFKKKVHPGQHGQRQHLQVCRNTNIAYCKRWGVGAT